MDFGMATFDSASHQELSKEMQKKTLKVVKKLASELHQLNFRVHAMLSTKFKKCMTIDKVKCLANFK
jgi:hypothetical protein